MKATLLFTLSTLLLPILAQAETIVCSVSTNTFREFRYNFEIRINGVVAEKQGLHSCREILARVKESSCKLDPDSRNALESIYQQRKKQGIQMYMYGSGKEYRDDLPYCSALLGKYNSAAASVPVDSENNSGTADAAI